VYSTISETDILYKEINKPRLTIMIVAHPHTVVELKSEEDFVTTINSASISALNFWAPWAVQCAQMNKVYFPNFSFLIKE